MYLSRDAPLTTGTGQKIIPNNMDLQVREKVGYSFMA